MDHWGKGIVKQSYQQFSKLWSIWNIAFKLPNTYKTAVGNFEVTSSKFNKGRISILVITSSYENIAIIIVIKVTISDIFTTTNHKKF